MEQKLVRKSDHLRKVYVESLQKKHISKINIIDLLAKLNEHYENCHSNHRLAPI